MGKAKPAPIIGGRERRMVFLGLPTSPMNVVSIIIGLQLPVMKAVLFLKLTLIKRMKVSSKDIEIKRAPQG